MKRLIIAKGHVAREGAAVESGAAGGAPPQSMPWLTSEKLLELIAHDINNLCHAALSYIDLALDPNQTPEARTRFLETARMLTHRVSRFAPHVRLLNEVREADVAGSSSEPLSKAFAEAREKAAALNFGTALSVEKRGDAWDKRVRGGPFVTAALVHVLDNATRYRKPGVPPKVWAQARLEGDFVVLEVRDNGKGFTKGTEGYAVRRFERQGAVSGAGLGLAFCRVLAERAGGAVEVHNAGEGEAVAAGGAEGAPAGGAVFTLRLPVAAAP